MMEVSLWQGQNVLKRKPYTESIPQTMNTTDLDYSWHLNSFFSKHVSLSRGSLSNSNESGFKCEVKINMEEHVS